MREAYRIEGVGAAGLREILSRGDLKLHEVSDCREAFALLRDESVPVLPCKPDHADGNMENYLNIMTSLAAPPNLIVFSRLADESFGAKVLNLGGFDVSQKRCCESPSLPGAAGSAAMLRVPLGRRKQRAVGECPDSRTNGKAMK
jgi:hypothetical protein